jgi:uncharacterized RDD family membrane protein YckC
MSIIQINTTQNVPIEFEQAGVGVRMLASMLDMIVMVAYLYVIGKFIDFLGLGGLHDSWSLIAVFSLFLLPVMLYTLAMEYYLNGQTLGKKIMKIKVVKQDGYNPRLSDFFIRWIFRLVDLWVLTPVIGIVSMVMTKNSQRFGGMASGTVVISIKKRHHIDAGILEEVQGDYQVMFPSVLMLTDRDVQIVKDNFRKAIQSNDYKLLTALRKKVASIIQDERNDMTDKEYLDTVLKDYTYMTQDS